jgi:hypothetical protein
MISDGYGGEHKCVGSFRDKQVAASKPGALILEQTDIVSPDHRKP